MSRQIVVAMVIGGIAGGLVNVLAGRPFSRGALGGAIITGVGMFGATKVKV